MPDIADSAKSMLNHCLNNSINKYSKKLITRLASRFEKLWIRSIRKDIAEPFRLKGFIDAIYTH